MKRMIDGLINYLVERGGCELFDDGGFFANIEFRFPEGYWPISLCSKPLSILPGHINHGDESDIAAWCFDASESPKWDAVAFTTDVINAGYGYNSITFHFTFSDSANREAFLKELFGKEISGQAKDITSFAIPVSMLLVAFDGRMEY